MTTTKKVQELSFWNKAYNKLTALAKWFYDNPYGYVRLVILAGAAGMWVFEFTKEHVNIIGVDAVAGVFAVIVVAHLLGGLKVIKR